jgi:membrane associated rhomboid family serine protease
MIPLRTSLRGAYAPVAAFLLVAVNVLVFLHELTLGPRMLDRFVWVWGLVPAREVAAGSIVVAVLSALTSMFVHGGWAHLLWNMLFLWVFGSSLESRIGHVRFTLLYFVSGILASQAQVWLSPLSDTPIVGASGAIAGVLGAYFVVSPGAKVTILFPIWIIPLFFDVPAYLLLAFWFAQQLLSGISSMAASASGGVAWWAHVGGFVGGMVLVRWMGVPPAPRRAPREWSEA